MKPIVDYLTHRGKLELGKQASDCGRTRLTFPPLQAVDPPCPPVGRAQGLHKGGRTRQSVNIIGVLVDDGRPISFDSSNRPSRDPEWKMPQISPPA